MSEDTDDFANKDTEPGMWPFRRTEDSKMAAVISELRGRVKDLEENDRRKDALLEKLRLEVAELRGVSYENRARLSEVLAKLDLGFNTLTALVNGLKNAEQPFSDFR